MAKVNVCVFGLKEFNNVGLVTKTKPRRLYLLNDLLVCVSAGPKQPGDFNNNERLSLKWAVPVNDVEVLTINSLY